MDCCQHFVLLCGLSPFFSSLAPLGVNPFEDVSVAATNRDPGARPTMAEVRGALAGKFELPHKTSGEAACVYLLLTTVLRGGDQRSA